jgi:hypothetical protein
VGSDSSVDIHRAQCPRWHLRIRERSLVSAEHTPHISPQEEWLREGHVDCVSCPVCAFTFDACHEDQGGGYSCPLCVELRLQEQLQTAQDSLFLKETRAAAWEGRARKAEEQLEAARDALGRVVQEYHARDTDWTTSDLKLPFRMKEHALKALASTPATEPKP